MKFKRFAILAFCAFFSRDAVCQRFSTQGEDGFTKPDFFIFARMNADQAGMYSNFLSAFQRAGFNVVNPDWAQQQINAEQNKIQIATHLSSINGELDDDQLKKQLKERGYFAGWRGALQSLVASGHVIEEERLIEGNRWDKTTSFYSWVEGREIPQETWSEPNTLHLISFNYTYRESLSCGTTLSELHGTIRDISGDLNEQIIDFDFSQPSLSSYCPQRIANEIVRRVTKDMREKVVSNRTAAKSDVSFNVKGDSNEIAHIQTILTIAKPGEDCLGLQGMHFEDELALGFLESYDVVDRSVTDHILKEHKLNMDGLFRDSDFIEAGQFAGAEALVTIQPTCLSNQNVLKVKMISINSSLLLWSAILKNADRSITAEELLEAIQY